MRKKIQKQQAEEESKETSKKASAAVDNNDYNDAPTYYQPTIIPQNPLSFEQKEEHAAFIEKLTN